MGSEFFIVLVLALISLLAGGIIFAIFKLGNELRDRQDKFRQEISQQQVTNLQTLQTSLLEGIGEVRQQMTSALESHTKVVATQIDKLTHTTEQRLQQISAQVEQRLTAGFEKTTETFTDVVKRLALIDEAQKKITELSSNVVGLQEILSDKKSRGAFGEVQLSNLVGNLLPEKNFSLQYTLSNNKRADCILFLPSPTGNVVIDAKFPLENYRKLLADNLGDSEKNLLQQKFRQDIRHHIQEIASKYIIPNETAEGAVMFIPAEAVFAEIHAHYYELVEYAQKSRVWMVSPTTMMAILTTARAVIKDDATREQVHIIQEHLAKLSKNFSLFRTRMDKLAQHIKQAHTDVDQIHISAEKITTQFAKIEQVELDKKEEILLDK
jgi:DNA recombination protein RmuC